MPHPPHIDLLDNSNLLIPVAAASGDFVAHLESIFSQFISAVGAADSSDPVVAAAQANVPAARALADGILETVKEYLRGHPPRAFTRLANALAAMPNLNDLLIETVQPGQLQCLYRARRFEGIPNSSRRDLFHIPTNKRHLVQTQRFSIPGFPCLYFGTTSMVCWNELGRPSLDSIATARFAIAKPDPIKLFNLALPPAWVKLRVLHIQPLVDPASAIPNYVSIWPLLAACSITVREQTAPFKPEYILPQLLLQWVTENPDIRALAYTSNRLPVGTSPALAQNLVFPPRDISTDALGHFHDFLDLFVATDPLPWALRKANSMAQRHTPAVGHAGYDVVPLVGASSTHYAVTSFYEYDSLLTAMPADRL